MKEAKYHEKNQVEFETLLQRLRKKDVAAFNEFVRRYYSAAAGMVFKRIACPYDREDKLQDFFLKFFEKNLFAQFRGKRENEFKAYFARILLNSIYQWYREDAKIKHGLVSYDLLQSSHNEMFSPDALKQRGNIVSFYSAQGKHLPRFFSQDVFDQTNRKDIEERLNKSIDQLPDNYRHVIKLRLLAYTNKEIALVLDKPLGTIDTWLARAFFILRADLKHIETNFKEVCVV